MKYLVIGSNSFSGSNFINSLLKKNNNVLGLSRSKEINSIFLSYRGNNNIKNFSFKKIDLNKNLSSFRHLLFKYKPDYIVNFSAQGMVAESWNNPIDWFETNLIAQIKIHDIIRSCGSVKKYVHFTTPEVYGNTKKKIKENFNFSPTTPYAVSRAACDMHLMSYYNAYNFPVIFTRAANVYGPGQQMFRIIPKTIYCALSNKKLNLHGGGLSRRSFIHIEDVSDAVYKICKYGKIGDSYHISTNEIITIKALVKKLCQLTKTDFREIVNISDERLGKDQAYLLDSTKIKRELSWNHKVSLEKGLKNTYEWVEKNLKILKKQPLTYKHKK